MKAAFRVELIQLSPRESWGMTSDSLLNRSDDHIVQLIEDVVKRSVRRAGEDLEELRDLVITLACVQRLPNNTNTAWYQPAVNEQKFNRFLGGEAHGVQREIVVFAAAYDFSDMIVGRLAHEIHHSFYYNEETYRRDLPHEERPQEIAAEAFANQVVAEMRPQLIRMERR